MRLKIVLTFLVSFWMIQGSIAQYITNDSLNYANSSEKKTKKVLIVIDGVKNINKPSTIDAFELYNLLGHFKTSVTILGSNRYTPRELNKYDVTFYMGTFPERKPSPIFMNDAEHSKKKIVWLNSGIMIFEKNNPGDKNFGFTVTKLDSSGTYNSVRYKKDTFMRGNDIMYIVHVTNKWKAKVIATAYSAKFKKVVPYIVKCGRFYYWADMPLYDATQSGRYLLFADMLHDILGENHPVEHRALVRIEDVTPIRDPQRLRNIADILSSRHIPFLVGVVPYYVDPGQNIYISLSQRPELVKALRYCVEKGATIVLHGVTHQYKGISGDDFEFWDGARVKPIVHEDSLKTEQRIEKGINECIRNGIYPLVWETPHYAASITDYEIFSKFFSSSIERRMLNDNYAYGQFFPYVINKDIYDEKVYPEDLGYVPYFDSRDSTEMYVHQILSDAKAIHEMRDGYASFFFHPFLDPEYLKEIVDGLCHMGFTFVDLRQQPNMVKTKDFVILSGTQRYCMNLNHSFLYEVYYNKDGDIEKKLLSKKPMNGIVSKKIFLKPDEFYMAEPMKYNKGEKGKMKNLNPVNHS